ncbi:diphthine--ammonia ligase [Thermocladium modestius]|uniref:diphthine--ammonia ligase n=1 Tax=Thermocladium modestius TaxID=62609 RepID=UPI00166702C5|nr:diphthine--ammonia ligase [Thermocladium modestius]
MRVCVLFSGGKDSVFAFHWAVLHGFQVDCLITFKPSRVDSPLFHVPMHVAPLLGGALGVPVRVVEVGVGEDEEGALVRGLMERAGGVDGVVTGALLSDFQRVRINAAAEALGLRVYSPLWRKDQASYLRWLVRNGFRFMIISITTLGIPPRFLGRVLGVGDVEELISLSNRFGFNPAFEGGEAETLVVDAPLYSSRLWVRGFPVRLGEFSWSFSIEEARLEPKV